MIEFIPRKTFCQLPVDLFAYNGTFAGSSLSLQKPFPFQRPRAVSLKGSINKLEKPPPQGKGSGGWVALSLPAKQEGREAQPW